MQIEDQLIVRMQRLQVELAREREAELEEVKREWALLGLAGRKARGVTIHPLQFIEERLIAGGRSRARFGFKPVTHNLQAGQNARLFRDEQAITGVITRVERDALELVVDDLPEWAEEGKPGIDLLFPETTYREMERALQAVRDQRAGLRLKRYAQLAGFGEIEPFQTGSTLDDQIDPALNPSQHRAVAAMVESPDFVFIHGPPGTGKTTTLVEGVVQLLRSTPGRILMVAPGNAAVDLLAEKLLQRGIAPLRLGHPGRVSESLLHLTVDGMIAAHANSGLILRLRKEGLTMLKQAKKFRRNFGPAEREERRQLYSRYNQIKRDIIEIEQGILDSILHHSRVILATPVGSTGQLIRELEFATVIIDEAAQLLEPAAWIALHRAPRWILAGDHCQLPPVVRATGSELARTLFEHAVESRQADNRGRIYLLDTQYRMEPAIMEFSNQEFYHGQLRCAASIGERSHGANSLFASPIVFIDTAGSDASEEPEPGSESLLNRMEAALLIHLLDQQLQHHGRQDDPGGAGESTPEIRAVEAGRVRSAAIIATYRAQANWIEQQLAQRMDASDWSIAVEVDTVDGFQGGERDWIGISLVRSNDDGEVGFLRDYRRINVALTRARRQLVIVGDSATISADPFFARLLEYIELHGELRSIYEFEL